MDVLNQMIVQYNIDIKQQASGTLSPTKRPISALATDDTSVKLGNSHDSSMEQKRQRLDDTENSKAQQQQWRQLQHIKPEEEMENSSTLLATQLSSHRSNMGSKADELFPQESDHILNVSDDATEDLTIDILGECLECEYQSVGEDLQRKRDMFDSSAKDTTSKMDFLLSGHTRRNELDGLVQENAHQTTHSDIGGSSAMAERARSTTPTAGGALGNIEDVKGLVRGPIREYGNERPGWYATFEALKSYKETHGDCLVRSRHPTLGSWVCRQRQKYRIMKEGKKSHMTQERIDLLDSIGFVWEVNTAWDQQPLWLGKFEELRKYKKTHGDCLVLRHYPSLYATSKI